MNKTKILLMVAGILTLSGCAARPIPSATKNINPENASYSIDGKVVSLKNRLSTENIPNSNSKITTSLFESNGNYDLNGDGKKDSIVILSQNSGGSGTFFYAAVAINSEKGFIGSNAIFLGDRIAPQTIGYANGLININYAERKAGDSFAVRPSVGVTKYLKFSNGQLVEASKP